MIILRTVLLQSIPVLFSTMYNTCVPDCSITVLYSKRGHYALYIEVIVCIYYSLNHSKIVDTQTQCE